jgi:hypothetical protein
MHALNMFLWTTDPRLLVAATFFVTSVFTAKFAGWFLRYAKSDHRMFPALSRSAKREREALFLARFKGETDNGRGRPPLSSGDAAPSTGSTLSPGRYVPLGHDDAYRGCPICAEEHYDPESGLCAWCDRAIDADRFFQAAA